MFKSLIRAVFGPELSIVHEFKKPPYGGGNQFLLALKSEFIRMGYDVGAQRVGKRTTKILFNSFNFDANQLRVQLAKFDRSRIKTVHRVDGPISAYRGRDFNVDESIFRINRELADFTVFQSQFSLEKHKEIGLDYGKNVCVIPNAVNPEIFFRPEDPVSINDKPVRVIATSWSDNPRKGADVFRWLDENLDFTKFEMTFVGNVQVQFKNIQKLAPCPSQELAAKLRSHHIYITASTNDPCSNALLEGLACGLPAIFRKSGGHPEIVKNAGRGFNEAEEIPALLDQLVADYDSYRSQIDIPDITTVAARYLSLFDSEAR